MTTRTMAEEKKKGVENTPAWHQQAIGLIHQGEHDKAIAMLSGVITTLARDVDKAVAYALRGDIYEQQGNYALTVADYTSVIGLMPNSHVAYNNRGVAYKNGGEYPLAIADYNKAIELKPDYAKAYANRGTAYVEQGNRDRAIADYDKAIDLAPNDYRIYVNRGSAYHEKGDNDRAIVDLNKAIDMNPNDAVAHNNRGNAYKGKREFDNAIADYNRAIELAPDNAAMRGNRGNAYYEKGENGRAIEDYQAAICLTPEQDTALMAKLAQSIKQAKLSEQGTTSRPGKKATPPAAKAEDGHEKRRNDAETCLYWRLAALFFFYLAAFAVVLLYVTCYETHANDLLWFAIWTVIMSTPIIMWVFISHKEKTMHGLLHQRALDDQRMEHLTSLKPRDAHHAEMIKKSFDRHDLRGWANLMAATEHALNPQQAIQDIFSSLLGGGKK